MPSMEVADWLDLSLYGYLELINKAHKHIFKRATY